MVHWMERSKARLTVKSSGHLTDYETQALMLEYMNDLIDYFNDGDASASWMMSR